MKNFISTIIVSFLIGLSACGSKNDKSQNVEVQQAYTCPMHPQIVRNKPGRCPICNMDLVPIKAGDDKLEVTLSESQIMLANITVQRVSVQPIGNSLLLNGRLIIDETETEIISTRVAGRLDKLFIKETGKQINRGQVIYEIYSEQLLAYQQEYLLALDEAKSHDNKSSTLYLQGAEKRLSLYGMSKTQINALSNSKTVNPRIQYFAQTSGVVMEIAVNEGQYVAEGTTIYKIEDLNTLWAEAELYPDEASLIKPGDSVAIKVNGVDSQPIESTVTFISPEYREGSQLFIIRTFLNNTENRFVPGMEVEIVFEHSKKNALALPVDAVIRDENGGHVYKKIGKGKFRPQMVTTGLENFNRVEVKEGVKDGDSIVVTGAYLLYSEIVLKKGVNPIAVLNHENKATQQTNSLPQAAFQESAGTVDPQFRQQLKAILLPYLDVKDAFVLSDMQGVSMQIRELSTALNKVDLRLVSGEAHMKWIEYLKRMNAPAKIIATSNNLEIQRASFAELTTALYASLKVFKVTGIQAYYQFCPMAFDGKGAYWISSDKDIRNPYFGEKMLRCGETKEIFK